MFSSFLVDKFYLKSASLLHSSGKVDGRSYRSFLLTRSFMVVVFAFQPPHRVHYVPNISQRSALIAIYNPRFCSRVSPLLLAAKKPTNNAQQTSRFCFRYRASDVYQTCFSSWRSCQEEKWVRKDKAPEDAFQAEKISQVISSVYVFNELEDVGGFGLGFVMIRELC